MKKKKEKKIKILKINKDIFLDYFIQELIEYFKSEAYNPKYALFSDNAIHNKSDFLRKEMFLLDLIEFKDENFDKHCNEKESINYANSNAKEIRNWIFKNIPKQFSKCETNYKIIFT